MSYKAMEAKLAEGILELRACERALAQSYSEFQSVPNDNTGRAVARDFDRTHAQMAALERLIAEMEAAKAVAASFPMSFVSTTAHRALEAHPALQV